jgi:hypothetical protein
MRKSSGFRTFHVTEIALGYGDTENVRIPCCDIEPPNRLCHSNSGGLTFGGQYTRRTVTVIRNTQRLARLSARR